jgi:hypothetical protein
MNAAGTTASEAGSGDADLAAYIPDPLMTELRRRTRDQAERLLPSEQRVRETVVADANLASAIADLRLQRNVFWLSVLVAILTILTVVLQATADN